MQLTRLAVRVACVPWALSFVMTLCGQDPSGPHSFGLVFPISGHPLCAQIEEQVQRLPEGSGRGRTLNGAIFRDQAGRMRTEWLPASGESPARTITLVDPVGGFIVVLDPASKVAVRMKGQPSKPDQFAFSLPGLIDPLPQGTWKKKTETIERRNIEGVEFEGTRSTDLSEDRLSLKIVHEWWTSKDLGLIGLAVAVGPNERHTVRIKHLDWREPDVGLFTVPSDYRLQELSLPAPNKE